VVFSGPRQGGWGCFSALRQVLETAPTPGFHAVGSVREARNYGTTKPM